MEIKEEWKQESGLYKCPHCSKEYSKKGIGTHVWANHTEVGLQYRKTRKENEKGEVKVGRVKSGCARSLEEEEKRRTRISETMKKNPKAGGLRQGSGRGKKCWYESEIAGRVFLDSTWELAYAKYLDANKIQWKRNWIKFPYQRNEKIHYYIPDFYLINSKEYIEVKGYEREEDKLKWEAFPYKLKVLKYEELSALGIEVKR